MRRVLIVLGAIAVVAAAAVAFVVVPSNDDMSADGLRAIERSYVPGSFRLEIGGADAGAVRVASLGVRPVGEVAVQPDGTKRVISSRPGDIVLDIAVVPPALATWILDTVQGSAPRDGAVVLLNSSQKVQTRTEFTGAVLTELTFPALDKAMPTTGFLRLTLAPQTSTSIPGNNTTPKSGVSNQGAFHTPSFRLTVSGINTSGVSSIAAVTIKRARGGPLELGNLRAEFLESSAASWLNWFEENVLDADHEEESVLLEYLDGGGRPVATLDFRDCGIFRLNSFVDTAPRMAADLYCERLRPPTFAVFPGAATTTSSNPATTVTMVPNGTPCDDGNPSTVNDRTVQGQCTGTLAATTTTPSATTTTLKTFFRDQDADGFGTAETTQAPGPNAPAGFSAQSGDCNDTNAMVKPGATEVAGNNVDENCDGKL